jgi:CheY-like chemotaxis protein
MRDKITALQAQRDRIKLLYVEDNDGLRQNVAQLTGKFFRDVYVARDGNEGLELFKTHNPDIVITDIKMDGMDGLQLAGKIHTLDPRTKVIVLSAHDTQEYLHRAIDSAIFRYISKPAKIDTMVDTLYDSVNALKEEERYALMQHRLEDVFNYQNHIIILFDGPQPVMVNRRFHEFFGIDHLNEFHERFGDIGALLLPHKGFLSSTPERSWFDTAEATPGKLYHVKMASGSGERRHLILKFQPIPQKAPYGIVSFDDVTELNLLKLFDPDATLEDRQEEERESIFKMLRIIKENTAEIKLHNFYRGLTITNPAVIAEIDGDSVTFKSSYTQLKAAQLVRSTLLSSELFPTDVICDRPDRVTFNEQTVSFSLFRFVERSPTERRHARLEPDENHTVTLFYRDAKVASTTRIVDLSESAVKLRVNALPPDMQPDEPARLSLVLPDGKGFLSVNTPATILRIQEHPKGFRHVVLIFDASNEQRNQIRRYLATRQMAIIREFKSLTVTEG